MATEWSWSEGEVDPNAEHIELRYGRADSGGWSDWTPVAHVAAPQDHVFRVQFLLRPLDERQEAALEAAKEELDFYLIEKGERDPWAYAQYHCGSTGNAYADVHWSYFPEGWTAHQDAASHA